MQLKPRSEPQLRGLGPCYATSPRVDWAEIYTNSLIHGQRQIKGQCSNALWHALYQPEHEHSPDANAQCAVPSAWCVQLARWVLNDFKF